MATSPTASMVKTTQRQQHDRDYTHGNGVVTRAKREDAPDDGRFVTEEEYWQHFYERGHDDHDASYEWNNGILEAKPLPNKVQLRLYKWFFILLEHYLQAYRQAEMIALETGFSLTIPDPNKPGKRKKAVRKPDIAVVRDDNPVRWGDNERSYRGICDLCIEALSDSTREEVERDTKFKKVEYLFAGVKEYYILDPSHANMHFYRRTERGDYVEILPNAEGVIQSTVLPGFQFRLTDLDRQPHLEDMAFDEVYRGFILPKYQAAEERAEQERQRAEEANERATRYAAKLRELGIEVDE